MEGLKFAKNPSSYSFNQIVSSGLENSRGASVEIAITWSPNYALAPELLRARPEEVITTIGLRHVSTGSDELIGPEHTESNGTTVVIEPYLNTMFVRTLQAFTIFTFEAPAMAAPVQTQPHPTLEPNGANLSAVLDALRDSHPERFEALNIELARWLPEFDRILFETPAPGRKTFLVRTTNGHHQYRPSDLSQGVIFAIAFLTLSYLPNPPAIVCFEEPDRGLHPRLLTDIKDAMYRLAFPRRHGERRPPTQVIATTHSPYLLDLYKEHPEEVVIAHKDKDGAHFQRLSDKPHISELLDGAPLGEIWFSGILGGVPSSL
jgi:predicted ATPase